MDKKEKLLVYKYLVDIILLDYVEDRLEYDLSDYIVGYPDLSREGCILLKSLIEEYSTLDFIDPPYKNSPFSVLEWLEMEGYEVKVVEKEY